jgi:peptidoglycan/LPS O-acetylase OafA/YrhL
LDTLNENLEKKGYLPQIDLLKGAAILSILFLHFFKEAEAMLPDPVWALLQTAVPVFVFVMGFNMARAFAFKPRGLRQYFKGRAKRLLPGFLIVFAASLLLGIFFGLPLDFGERQLVGFFPVPGMGNYFIPLVFQFVILFPLLYYIYKKNPIAALIALFAIDAGFEAGNLFGVTQIQIVYQYCILRYLAIIWLGFFFADRLSKAEMRKGLAVAAKMPGKFLGLLGRASYHIFLIQILIFSRVGSSFGISPVNKLLVSIAIGLLFYYLNSKALPAKRRQKK